MKLGMPVGLGPGHIVLDFYPAPLPQRGTDPSKFLANICCGRMAAAIRMPLGMEVGLGPGDFVLDGDPAPLPKKAGERGPCFLWPNGWMHHDATWYGCRPQPRGLCVRSGPRPPPQKGGGAPSPISAHVYCGLSSGDFVLDGAPAFPPLKEHNPQFLFNVGCAKRLDGLRWHLVWR